MTTDAKTIAQDIVAHWSNIANRLEDEIERHEIHGRFTTADRLRHEVDRLRQCADEVKQRFDLKAK